MASWSVWASSVAGQLKSSSSSHQPLSSVRSNQQSLGRLQIKPEFLLLISELRDSAIEVATLDSKVGTVLTGHRVERLAVAIDSIMFHNLRHGDTHISSSEGDYWRLILAVAEHATQPEVIQGTQNESILRASVRQVLPPKLKRVKTKRGLCKAWARAILTNRWSNNLALDLSNLFRALSLEKNALIECYNTSYPSGRGLHRTNSNKVIDNISNTLRKTSSMIVQPDMDSFSLIGDVRPVESTLDTMLGDKDIVEIIVGALAVLHPLTSKKQKLFMCLDDHTLDDASSKSLESLSWVIPKAQMESEEMEKDSVVIEVSGTQKLNEFFDSMLGVYKQDGYLNNAPRYRNKFGFELFVALVVSYKNPAVDVKRGEVVKEEQVESSDDEMNLDSVEITAENIVDSTPDTVDNEGIDTVKQMGCYRWYLGSSETRVAYYSAPFSNNRQKLPPTRGWMKTGHGMDKGESMAEILFQTPKFKILKGNEANQAISDSDIATLPSNEPIQETSEWPTCVNLNASKVSTLIRGKEKTLQTFEDMLENEESYEFKFEKFERSKISTNALVEECLEPLDLTCLSEQDVRRKYEQISQDLYYQAMKDNQQKFEEVVAANNNRHEKYMHQREIYENEYQKILDEKENEINAENGENGSTLNVEECILKCTNRFNDKEIEEFKHQIEDFKLNFTGLCLEDVLLDAKLVFDGTQAANQAAKCAIEKMAEKAKERKEKVIQKEKIKEVNQAIVGAVKRRTAAKDVGEMDVSDVSDSDSDGDSNNDIASASTSSPVVSPSRSQKEASSLTLLSTPTKSPAKSGLNSGSGSNNSSRSTTPVRSTSSNQAEDTTSTDMKEPPPSAVSSATLLKRLREQGRRLVWLPPERVSCELKSVEVLGVDEGLYVLRVSKVTIKTTPLIQPEASSSRQGSFDSKGSFDENGSDNEQVGSMSGEKGASFLLEHISRLEVCTLRVSLVQLEHMHSSIEHSLKKLLRNERKEETDSKSDSSSDSGFEDVGNDSAEEVQVNNNPKSEMMLPPLSQAAQISNKELKKNKYMKRQLQLKTGSGGGAIGSGSQQEIIVIPDFPKFPSQEVCDSTKNKKKGFLGMSGTSSSSEEKVVSSLASYMSELLSLQYSKAFYAMYVDNHEVNNVPTSSLSSPTNRLRASSHVYDFENEDFECVRESVVGTTSPLSKQSKQNKQVENDNIDSQKLSMKVSEVISNRLWALRHGIAKENGLEVAGRHAVSCEKEVFDSSISPGRKRLKNNGRDDDLENDVDEATESCIWGVENGIEHDLEDDYGASAYLDISLTVDDETELQRRAAAAGSDPTKRQPSSVRGDLIGGKAILSSRSEEEQLRRQNHRCQGCGVSLSSSLFSRNYAPCRFLDALFCKKYCHKDEHRVIPRCVLHHWDFVPHRVCRSSAAFLDDISRLPLLDVSLLSPGLLSAQSSLRNVRSLRHQLSYLRDLVYKAKFERGMKLFKTELGGRIHLVLDTEIFSMKDLEQVNIGQMKPILDSLLDSLSEMAGSSTICRKWLTDAEKASYQSGGGAGASGNLRLEERLLYRSLLGISS